MKKLVLLSLLLWPAAVMQAKTLTPAEALARVKGDIHATRGNLTTSEPRLTMLTEAGSPAIYVFSDIDGPGILIVSADDAVYPLLGYSDRPCDGEDVPPQLKWWLGEYARQIEYATANNIDCRSFPATREREAVKPLLTTTWNQTDPYNLLTPEVGGQHTPTGCVATAMAQVMNYWKYPDSGTGSVSVILPSGKSDMMNLRQVKFDWADMLDSYVAGNYNEKQADAVAVLMKACGYASDMTYAPGGSGAVSMVSATAFVKNFKYNKNIQFYDRDYLSASEWESIVYNELANGRPIMYGGQSTSVGHSFVCDGYDGNGYYHFNWGWGGMSDGYFLLNALNPYAVGTGGGQGGGYNFGQDIIAGVQPEESAAFAPALSQFGTLSATCSGRRFTLKTSGYGWMNTGVQTMDVDFGVEIIPADGKENPAAAYILITTEKINPPKLTKKADGTYVEYSGIGSGQTFSMPEDLADGKYRLRVCTRPSGGGEGEWHPVMTTREAYPYLFFDKKGEEFSITNMAEATVAIMDVEIISPLYYGCATKMKVTARNNSEKTLTQPLYPLLAASGSDQMLGEGIIMTVDAGETKTEEFTTVFELLQGASAPSSRRNYTLRFIDPSTSATVGGENGEDWEKKVTMNINFSTPDVACSELDMPGLGSEEREIEDKGTVAVYQVYDKNVVEFSCSLQNNRGFFGYPVYGVIFESSNLRDDIDMVELSPTPALAEGDETALSGSIDFSQGEQGKIYVVVPYALIGNSFKQLSADKAWYFEIADPSAGVNEIAGLVECIDYDNGSKEIGASGIVLLKVCDSNGRTVFEASPDPATRSTYSLGNLPRGIYIATGIIPGGRTVARKILR